MEPPLKPSESDCCNSGCNPCILDVYEEQLRKYNSSSNTKDSTWRNCISETSYTIFKLIKIDSHTHNTYFFTFEYVKGCKDSTTMLALIYNPGQHFLLKGHSYPNKNDQFTRAYTPIPVLLDRDPLSFTVLIKLYEHGAMSKFIKRLNLDSETFWRGPYGSFQIDYNFRFMLLIAQGIGIAPLYAVICNILNNTECETFLKLFHCCQSEQDIVLRNELYELSSFWNFTYDIFLSKPSNVQCKYNEIIHLSRLQKNNIQAHLEAKLENIQVLICGSDLFNQDMLKNVLDCGVDESTVYLF